MLIFLSCYAHYFYYAIIRYSSLTTPTHVETKWRLRVAADLLEGEGRDEEMKKREGEERRLTHTDTFCRA